MPGKVNPVIPEVVNQVAFEVIGNDVTVSFAAEAGQLQLNAFEPIIAHSLFKSVNHLRQACLTLEPNAACAASPPTASALRRSVERSIGIVTALNPYIGYANATAVAQEAHASGRSVHEVVLEKGLLSKERLEESPARDPDPAAANPRPGRGRARCRSGRGDGHRYRPDHDLILATSALQPRLLISARRRRSLLPRPGTNSSPSRGPSCPSDCAIGPVGSDHGMRISAGSGFLLSALVQ